MPTLILPQRYTPDSVALWQAAIEEGWPTKRLQGWQIKEPIEGEVVIYGEHLFALTMAEQLNLKLLRPPLDWLTQLPSAYLKRHIHFTQLSNIGKAVLPAFIKPADDKCFAARVYENAQALPDFNLLPAQTPILFAEPVIWQTEFRAFILHRNLATISIYSRSGQPAQINDGTWPATQGELVGATNFIHQLLADATVNLPPAVVLDVGVIESKGWAVVEANPVWASGIYGCEPRQVLHTIARACKPAAQISPTEEQWSVV